MKYNEFPIHTLSKWFFILILISATNHHLRSQDTLITIEGPSTPYEAVYQLLYYLQEDSYQPELAARAVHPESDSLKSIEHAIKIKQVLDGKGLFVRMNQIPDETDYRDSITKRSVYTLFPAMLPEIYLEKYRGAWFFSKETSQQIEAVHNRVYPFGIDRLLEMIPAAYDRKFLGLKVWQYLGILVYIVLAYIIHFLLSRIINFLILRIKWMKRFTEKRVLEEIYKIAKYASIWIILMISRAYMAILQLGIRYTELIMTGIRIALVIIILIILIKIINIVAHYAELLAFRTESKMDEQLLPIIVKLTKIVLVGLFLFQILALMRVNVTALIAGVSIGGLALALAAQDTVKNLIGSVMIFIDKPFQIGDFVAASGFTGTVEEVGFRSTRIRTVGSSVISVPNGTIANLSLENLGIRKARMMQVDIAIVYSTPIQKIQEYVGILKNIINEIPEVDKEVFYIHLTEMKDSSLNILFRIYLQVETYKEELELKEKILHQIIGEAEKLEIEFAFPSTSVYLENTTNAPAGEE